MDKEELESLKQKMSDIEMKLANIDLDAVASKKGSKLKDRMVASEVDTLKQRISDIESILDDGDFSALMSKKGSKLKDR